MTFEWFGSLLVALTLAGCVVTAGAVVASAMRLRQYHALRPGGVAREKAALACTLPPDEVLPHVVVQIPTYNEGMLVVRSIAQATGLDWPASRLHVQVCDSSNDDTVQHAELAAGRARADGADVTVLHLDTRHDFKAGALRAGMAAMAHEYFLVFDVDFVYAPDFLRQCMKILLADPGLGFVQARISALNGEATVLTRAQRILFDADHGFEQAHRSWAGEVLSFNGTGGIWRRAAIEAAGGWSGASVTEDLDLSFRAWLEGWRGAYLTSVTAFAELPTHLTDWMAQNRRWMAGIGEVGLSLLPRLARSGTGRASVRDVLSSPLMMWVTSATVMVMIGTAVLSVIMEPAAARLVISAVAVALGGMVVVLFAAMRAANRFCRPGTPLWRFGLDFLPVPLLMLYSAWACLRSVPTTLLGRRRVFHRTPKSMMLPGVSQR